MLCIPHALKNSLLPLFETILDKNALSNSIEWVSSLTQEQAYSFAEHLLSHASDEQKNTIFQCVEIYYSFLYTQFNEQDFKSLLGHVQNLLRKTFNPKISCILDTTKKSILIKEYQPKQNKPISSHTQKNKNALYTCITGNYDGLIQHKYISPDWDYLCFTDQENLLAQKTVGHWQIKPLRHNTVNPQLTGRWHKIHPHVLLPEYNQCLYLDGNINVLSPYLFECVKIKQDQYIFGQFIHPVRDCIYDEISACLAGKKENKAKLQNVKNLLLQNHFPAHWGLSETGILFRKQNDPLCIKIMDEWWFMLENYSVRDQVSLMYILWKNNLQPEWLCPYAYRQLKHDFTVIQHKKNLIIQ